MRRRVPLVALGALLTAAIPAAATSLEVAAAGAAHRGGPMWVKVKATPDGATLPSELVFRVDGELLHRHRVTTGESEFTLQPPPLRVGWHEVSVEGGEGGQATARVLVIPGVLSVLPPLVAIALALIFRDVLVSLFVGVFSGALILAGGQVPAAFARSIDEFLLGALADKDHAAIIIFSTLLGGMVGIINRSGGTQGIVAALSRYATTARSGQLSAWLMGVLVFFDDYANTLIVGSTMRPVTDRLRVSREKLAYIVDSTAAPVASLVPLTTWIGFEVGLIAAAFADIGAPYNAYTTFIATIPYRFYPIFALVLGFAVAVSGRDFGPMLAAERRARRTGEVLGADAVPLADFSSQLLVPPEGKPLRAANAMLPILTVIAVTVGGLYLTGRAEGGAGLGGVRDAFAAANPFKALLWASLAGVVAAAGLAIAQRILSLRETMTALVEGLKSMLLAMVVLTLAWSIGAVCSELHTAEYVVGATRSVLSVHWLPVLVFLVSAAVSFATGTSWGTMAIVMPLVVPIAHGLAVESGLSFADPTYRVLMLGAISSVLAGSVWGDHCSPISDTTVMSSMASGCDHIAHVRTQLPYALAVGALGMVVGDIPTAFGLSPWISLAVGVVIIVAGVRVLGRRVEV
jgi:Na+/H+ antiporter NhaC